ncbi:MAG: endonuclease MutS2 [Acidobacteriota bacterium]
MDVRTLRALEWDRVLALLSLCTDTTEGRQRALARQPGTDIETVRARHARVAECLAGESLCGRLSLEGYTRVPTRLPEGLAFPIETLRSLRSALRVLDRLRAWLADTSCPKPALTAQLPSLEEASDCLRLLEKTLDDRGEVADGASDRLRGLRRERERARGQVASRMEALVRRLGSSVLQNDNYTVRGGRLVLPVQSSRRSSVKGILHDTSSTGATAFIEPLEVVDLNNRLTDLDAEEREEIQRILTAVSSRISAGSPELEAAFDYLEALDVDLACARLGRRCGGILPLLDEEGRLLLRGARHPLLDGGLAALRQEAWGEAAEGGEAVPLELELHLEGEKTLVISGPNAGGKSVALKTVGLLCLMHQGGIPIPVREGTRLPVFPFIHATVGDSQSILDSLSTFSARMVGLRDALSSLQEPFLVILDELGSGTDPAEGAALAEAILLHFHRLRGFTLCSTHYESLKARALVTDGMTNGGMEFEETTLRPTYRFKIGQVGASRALAVAGRSGLPAGLLTEARAFLPEGEKHLREVLEALEGEVRAVEAERSELRAEMASLGKLREEMALSRREWEAERRRILEELPRRMEAWREEFLAGLKAEVNRQSVKRVSVQSARRVAEVVQSQLGLDPLPYLPSALPAVGDRVRLPLFGQTGTVTQVDEGSGRLLVDCNGKSLQVGRADVEILPRDRAPERRGRGGVALSTGDAHWEINLIGQTVAEAESQLEPFLERAAMAGLGQVRVIHGLGTGRLKAGVREFLRRCPHVASWEEAPPAGGGAGVTLVSLKD